LSPNAESGSLGGEFRTARTWSFVTSWWRVSKCQGVGVEEKRRSGEAEKRRGHGKGGIGIPSADSRIGE